MNYTYEQVLSLASDAATAKKAANKSKWSNHGADDQSIWGEYKGSGKKPYFTAIDLHGPAFKCSCPSRKFPCKHSIGLFLLYVTEKECFTNKDAPEWVTQWLDKRRQKTTKKEKELTPEQKAKSDADKTKRQEKRLKTMQSGLDDLEIWIHDIIRQGLGNIQTDDYSFWEEQGRRATDAQMKGLANLIREIREMLPQDNWMELVLERLAEIYLLIQAFRNRDKLSPELTGDIMTWIGLNTKKEDILELQGIKDHWAVLSVTETQEDLFTSRKTWLWGQKEKRFALILDFYRDNMPLQNPLVAGMAHNTEVVFYPSAFPVRALLKASPDNHRQIQQLKGFESFTGFLEHYADDYQKSPLHWSYPCIIHQVKAAEQEGDFFLLDNQGFRIPLLRSYTKKWRILALSGGHLFTVFGEWKNYRLEPLSLFVDGNFFEL